MPTAATSTGALLTAKVAELLGPEEPRGGHRQDEQEQPRRPAATDSSRRYRATTSCGHPASDATCPSASSRIASWVASARSSVPATVPPCITAIRSLMPRISGSSDEIIRIAMPRAASSPISRWISALAPTSTPCVGSSRISTAGSVASQRASATFCWLPPERLPTGSSIDARLDRRAAGRSRRRPRRSRPKSSSPQRRDRAEDGERRVRRDRHVEDHAVPAAVLGHVGDAQRDGPRGRVDRRPACRAGGSRPRRPASGRRGPAPAPSAPRRPARPGPRISPARTSGSRRARPPPGSPGRATSSTTSPIGTARLGKTADSSRPTIMRISSARSTSAIGRVPTSAPSRSTVTRSATAAAPPAGARCR